MACCDGMGVAGRDGGEPCLAVEMGPGATRFPPFGGLPDEVRSVLECSADGVPRAAEQEALEEAAEQ